MPSTIDETNALKPVISPAARSAARLVYATPTQVLPGGISSAWASKTGTISTITVPGRNRSCRSSKLVGRPQLACGNRTLYFSHHHRYHGQRLGRTGNFSNHADFQYLGRYLTEAGLKPANSRVRGHQYSGGSEDGVNDVARPQRKLFDRSINTGIDGGFINFGHSPGRVPPQRWLFGRVEIDQCWFVQPHAVPKQKPMHLPVL